MGQCLQRFYLAFPDTFGCQEGRGGYRRPSSDVPLTKGRSTLSVWIEAVTHKTDKPNGQVFNYETLETVGDKSLDYALIMFALKYLGAAATPHMLTAISHTLMTKRTQPAYTRALGLNRWVIGDPNAIKSVDVEEDVFESLNGALVTTCDMIEREDIATRATLQLMRLIFEKSAHMIQIRRTETATDSYKTEVMQRGERLGWTKKDTMFTESKDYGRSTSKDSNYDHIGIVTIGGRGEDDGESSVVKWFRLKGSIYPDDGPGEQTRPIRTRSRLIVKSYTSTTRMASPPSTQRRRAGTASSTPSSVRSEPTHRSSTMPSSKPRARATAESTSERCRKCR